MTKTDLGAYWNIRLSRNYKGCCIIGKLAFLFSVNPIYFGMILYLRDFDNNHRLVIPLSETKSVSILRRYGSWG